MTNDILRDLRESIGARSRELDRVIFSEYARVVQAILGEESSGRIDRTTAAQLRILFREQFAGFVEKVNKLTDDGIEQTIGNVTAKWHASVGRILKRQAVDLSIDWKDVRPEALRLMARTRGAEEFRSLLKYKLQKKVIPQLDSIIDTSIARGTSAEDLKRQIARVMVNEDPRVVAVIGKGNRTLIQNADSMLGQPNFAKNLLFDARRIAVSENNNALRESNRAAADITGMVAAMHWNLSGRHGGLPSSPDECDALANADLFGFGPGYYPPKSWPQAPHPLCGCYQGAVKFLPKDQWGSDE